VGKKDVPEDGSRRPDVRRFPARLALAVLPIALLVLWMWLAEGPRRAIEGIPPAERLTAYRAALEAFETLCTETRPGLETTCIERARLLIDFPECDRQCREVTLPHLRARRG
jgi:hypothetical protein